jgi:hypothetical protein
VINQLAKGRQKLRDWRHGVKRTKVTWVRPHKGEHSVALPDSSWTRCANLNHFEEQAGQNQVVFVDEEVKTNKRPNISLILSLIKWKLTTPTATLGRILEFFVALITRSYFSRVWVMKEVFLAETISLCCGTDHHSMEALRGLSIILRALDLPILTFVHLVNTSSFLSCSVKDSIVHVDIVTIINRRPARRLLSCSLSFVPEHTELIYSGSNEIKLVRAFDTIGSIEKNECLGM